MRCAFCKRWMFIPCKNGGKSICLTCWIASWFRKSSPKKEKPIDLQSAKEILDFVANTMEAYHSQKCECGCNAKSFNANFKFGCPNCYGFFHDDLKLILQDYHGSNKHVGKIPKIPQQETEDHEDRLKLLKLQLVRAIEMEQYELAAKLKKDIEITEKSQ